MTTEELKAILVMTFAFIVIMLAFGYMYYKFYIESEKRNKSN
jgi:preprotein translocase subunit SecG